jgi:precorrin-2 methylase
MLFYLLSADELGEIFERLDYTFEYETIPGISSIISNVALMALP